MPQDEQPEVIAPIAKARPEQHADERRVHVRVTLPDTWTADTLEAQREADHKLHKKLTLQSDGNDLESLLKVISEQAQLNLDINWPAMELHGVARDQPIILDLSDVPASSLLDAVLAQAGAEMFGFEKPAWVNHMGVVKVAPISLLVAETEVRHYDIGVLLRERFRPMEMVFDESAFDDAISFRAWMRGQRSYPFTDAMLLAIYKEHVEDMTREISRLERELEKLEVPENIEPEREGFHGGGLFGDDEPEHGPKLAEGLGELIDLLEEMTGYDNQWLDEESSIRVSGTSLVVSADLSTHLQIEALLNNLLAAELEDQVSVIKDAEICRLLYEASVEQKAGRSAEALDLVERALLIDPDHLPANAMRRVYAGIAEREAAE